MGLDIASLSLIQYNDPLPLLPDIENDLFPQEGAEAPLAFGESLPPSSITKQMRNEDHVQSWFYYITDITLRKLEIQIDTFFRSLQSKPMPPGTNARQSLYRDIVTALADSDKQIVDHFSNLPSIIAIDTTDGVHSPDDLREYLRLRMIRIRHDLSRPALYFVLHGSLGDLCPDLYKQALEIANRAVAIANYLLHHGLSTHRHPGTWLGIRYCTRAAVELLAVSKTPIAGLIMLTDWSVGMEKFKTSLRYWMGESRDVNMYLEWIAKLESTD